ncbi:MAG TPA: rod shape-determining protein MreD [Thermoanaerobaculia bacterium]|nr:rod shape-determining protein MreD [Thermoanaerobaculia bacterium]
MRFLRLALALAAVAALQFAGTRLVPAFPLAVDLFLLLTVLVARAGRPVDAMLTGLAAGWTADALTVGPFGIHGLADTVVGYATARVAQQLVVQRKSSQALVFAAAAAVHAGLLVLLGLAFDPTRELPSLAWLPVKAAATALLGLAWTGFAETVRLRWSRRRRRRPSGTVDLGR